jgi:hypothetical protein
MLFKDKFCAYSENHKKSIKTLCGQNPLLLIVKWGGMNYNLKTENNAVIFKIPASYWGDKFVTMKIEHLY